MISHSHLDIIEHGVVGGKLPVVGPCGLDGGTLPGQEVVLAQARESGVIQNETLPDQERQGGKEDDVSHTEVEASDVSGDRLLQGKSCRA